ncbi:hypothetical protein [Hazenella coriacea]|nr:hypothetical protein [Hazenella coriacea]
MKRYPYIQVKSIPNAILDACLLMRLESKHLFQLFNKEPALLRKSNLTMTQIRQKKVTKQTLIKEISEQLSQHYLVYNSVVAASLSRLSALEFEYLNREEGELLTEECEKKEWLKQQFEQAIEEDKMPFDLFVTWLRFQESFHSEIQGVLEKNGNQFERLTSLTLPDSFQFDRKEIDLNVFTTQERIDLAVKVLQSIQIAPESEIHSLIEDSKENMERLKKQNEHWREQSAIYGGQVKKKEKEWVQLKKKLDEERVKTKTLKQEVKTQQKKIQDSYTRAQFAEQERDQMIQQVTQLKAEKQQWLAERQQWSESQYNWEIQLVEWTKERNQYQQELERLQAEKQKLREELQTTICAYEQKLEEQQNQRHQEEAKIKRTSTVPIDDDELDGLFSGLEENLPQPL